MKIRIPRRLVAAWDFFCDAVNVPVFTVKFRSHRHDVLRIDILLAILFCICVGWYYIVDGWFAALVGGLTFVFFAMCALWMF